MQDMLLNPLSIITAFVMTMAAAVMLKPLSIRLGLVDEPGGRKKHEGNVPLIGGIAMFLGFGFSLLTLDVSLSDYRCLIAGCVILVITGVLDDFHELGAQARLAIQFCVAIMMVMWAHNTLFNLGDLFYFGNIDVGLLGFPITVFAVLAVINAVNMTDGVDGLAGTIGFVELFYLSWIAHASEQFIDAQVIYVLLGAMLGFLCFNFPLKSKAKIFMGDSGSMMLGFVLVWFCVELSQVPYASPVTFLWVLAVPLWDISSVVIRRLLKGFSPLQADRGHLHHYLLEKGYSPLQVTLFIGMLSAVLGLMGVAGQAFHVPQSLMFIGFLGLFSLYLWLLHRAWTGLTVSV